MGYMIPEKQTLHQHNNQLIYCTIQVFQYFQYFPGQYTIKSHVFVPSLSFNSIIAEETWDLLNPACWNLLCREWVCIIEDVLSLIQNELFTQQSSWHLVTPNDPHLPSRSCAANLSWFRLCMRSLRCTSCLYIFISWWHNTHVTLGCFVFERKHAAVKENLELIRLKALNL